MTRLEMEKYKMILTEKQQIYQQYHQVKPINMNTLQVKKYYFNQGQVIKQAKSTYSPLGKALEKQTKQLNMMENNWLSLMHLSIKMIMMLKTSYFCTKKKDMIKFFLKIKLTSILYTIKLNMIN